MVSTLVGRLVPGVRQLISIPAGLSRMHVGKFLLYTTIGAGAWNCVLAFLGYYVIPAAFSRSQNHRAGDGSRQSLQPRDWLRMIGLIRFCLLAYAGYKYLRHRKEQQNKKDENAL